MHFLSLGSPWEVCPSDIAVPVMAPDFYNKSSRQELYQLRRFHQDYPILLDTSWSLLQRIWRDIIWSSILRIMAIRVSSVPGPWGFRMGLFRTHFSLARRVVPNINNVLPILKTLTTNLRKKYREATAWMGHFFIHLSLFISPRPFEMPLCQMSKVMTSKKFKVMLLSYKQENASCHKHIGC